MRFFVHIFCNLLFVVGIYSSWITLTGPADLDFPPEKVTNTGTASTNATTINVTKATQSEQNSSEGNQETSTEHPEKEDDYEDDKALLTHIEEVVRNSNTNSSTPKHDGNLKYYALIAKVPEESTDIVWPAKVANASKIILFENATRLLANTTVKIFIFEEERQCEHKRSDIIVVEAESTLNKSNPILQIRFEKNCLPQKQWKCIYWDNKTSDWSSFGIITTLEKDDILCLSNHLSAFSIMLDPLEMPSSEEDSAFISYLSRLGSFISIFFLLLVVMMNFNRQMENETIKILLNSSIALLFTHISYQIYEWLHDSWNCSFINFLAHYSVLSFLLWTAADGVHMWRILITDVFNTRGYIFYRWYRIISWGIPLISSSLGIFFTKSDSNEKCQLRYDEMYNLVSYIIPCMLILGSNMLLFTWMLVNVTCKDSLGPLRNKKVNYVLALTQVFGIGWCIAVPFLWFKPTHLLGQYVFVGVASTQGFLIFIVRCSKNKNLRIKLLNDVFSSLTASSKSVQFRGLLKSTTDLTSASSTKNG